jgi:hypothetical protein
MLVASGKDCKGIMTIVVWGNQIKLFNTFWMDLTSMFLVARIDVLRKTLTQVEGSMLASRFSGRWDDSLEKDADGNFFIDQPEKLFILLIDFLRAKQIETPLAKHTDPPYFECEKETDDFNRMVEYYGLTLAVYPIGLNQLEEKKSTTDPDWRICDQGECNIESLDWATYSLQPFQGCHSRVVDSFEVTIEKCSTAQIGWIDASVSSLRAYRSSEGGRGVGYGSSSMALDCVKSCVVVLGFSVPLLSGGIPVNQGCTIRSEKGGQNWFVDGTLVASTILEGDNVTEFSFAKGVQWYPCISVRGSCKISKIELVL